MENNSQNERKKSVLGAITANKLTEMLKKIDINSITESSGIYNARARIVALFDMGTFVETGAYIARSSYCDEFEGVITGYGAVGGRLVYAFVQDSSRMKGAFDSSAAEKIAAIYNLALSAGAPVVGIFDSCGATVYEGVRVMAAYGKLMRLVATAHGVIPQIALVPGVCGGGMAALAAGFDFILCVKDKSELYAAAPFISGEAAADGSELADIVADSEEELYFTARELIGLIPSNCREGARCSDFSVFDRETEQGLSTEQLANSLSDSEKAIRLSAHRSPEIYTGLAFVGGIGCGIIANCSEINGGKMTISACRTAIRLVRFCDAFGLPLIALVDSDGLDAHEKKSAEYASVMSELYTALTLSENAKISAVVGHAYGIGFTLMASKAVGGDIAFATHDACISAMSPEASVAFVWNDRICRNDVSLTVTRDELEAEWRKGLASPNDAALCGQIDDLIEITELRPRIVSAVRMLAGKSSQFPSPRKEGRKNR